MTAIVGYGMVLEDIQLFVNENDPVTGTGSVIIESPRAHWLRRARKLGSPLLPTGLASIKQKIHYWGSKISFAELRLAPVPRCLLRGSSIRVLGGTGGVPLPIDRDRPSQRSSPANTKQTPCWRMVNFVTSKTF